MPFTLLPIMTNPPPVPFLGYRTFYNVYDEPCGTEHYCKDCHTLVQYVWALGTKSTCKCMDDGTQLVPGLPYHA